MQLVSEEEWHVERIRSSGIVILIGGIWGALVPFAGPAFGYQMGMAGAWTWTESHLTLHLLPGSAAILGGALLLGRSPSRARLGAIVALVGGGWFILGPLLHPAWAGSGGSGMMMGDSVWSEIFVSLGYHYGTGVVIATMAAYALGALSDRRSAVTQQVPATEVDASATTAPLRDREHANVS